MRIAMFSDSYYPYISGVTRAVAVARETLESMGHDVSIFCPRYPGCGHETGVIRLPSFKAPTNPRYYVAYPAYPRVVGRLRLTKPDVVHIHSPFNLCKTGLSASRWLGVPVVLTYHTMYSMYAHYVPVLGGSVSGIVEGTALRVARSVDAVITPSTTLAQYLESRGIKTPLYPIPNGINVSEFQSGDPEYLRTVDVWIKRLRFGLREAGAGHMLRTVHGKGYVLDLP